MSNLPVWLIAALVAVLVGALLLGGVLKSPEAESTQIEPAIIKLDEKLARFGEVTTAMAESLFESEEATLALLRIGASIAPHVHHESNEVLYVLNGTGKARTTEVEYALSPGMMLILFAESPIEIMSDGAQPLDLLIFLSPPSNESNVTRLDAPEFLKHLQSSLAPILINANEQLESLSIQARAIPSATLSNFSNRGNVGLLQLLNGSALNEKKRPANLLFYVVGGEATARIGTTESSLEPGDFVIIPGQSDYQIETTSEEPLNLIFFAAPSWKTP